MSDLTNWQESLPEIHIPHRQLAKPLARMECVALLSRLAMNVACDTHVHTVLRTLAAIQQAELLKQAAGDLPAEVEAYYHSLTEQFLADMEAIAQGVSARLLEESDRIPEPGDGSLLSRLREWLSG